MNYLGLEKNKLTTLAAELNDLLANYQLYYQNLRNFHWNVSGPHFFDLHREFEDLYVDARVKIDDIAERLLTLRFRPLSNLTEYLDRAKVEEAGQVNEDREMVRIVLQNHQELIACMRRVLDAAGKVDDEGTIDMIGSFLENLEKRSWILDAWAARKREPAMA